MSVAIHMYIIHNAQYTCVLHVAIHMYIMHNAQCTCVLHIAVHMCTMYKVSGLKLDQKH